MVAQANANLVARPGLFERARGAVVGAVERLLGVGLPVFGRSGAPIPVNPPYPVERSEQAFLSNPWVYAAFQAVTTDLSGLPLIAETGTGMARRQNPDHPLLALFERPHPKVSGRKWRKQLVADLLTGNAYARVWRDPTARPFQLGRIAPAAISVLVGADGEEVGWKLQNGTALAWSEVLHIADISLSSSPDLVLGTNRLQSLALGLQVDRDSRRMAGRAAKRGRLEMMLSPTDAGARVGEERVNALVESYAQAGEAGYGLYVTSMGMTATPLSLTARDAEYLGERDRSRQEVLAVFATPETRVGSPAANYGTAREQSRIYWQNLQSLAALFDDELSRLAEPGVRIRHDFSAVDALQPSRSERLARVLQLVSLGMDPNEALRYEGFFDAPKITVSRSSTTAPAAPSSSGVQEPRKGAEVQILAVLRTVAGLFAEAPELDEVVPAAKHLLRKALEDLGARDAEVVASEAAAVCAESVRAGLADDASPIDLGAFGHEHAKRIVRLARLDQLEAA